METAFEQLLSAKAQALITATDPILLDRREQIASFALRHKVLAMGFVQQIALAGGLLSYGPSISWMYRQAGDYVGQILKGSNPAEMPVLQPTHLRVGDQPEDRQGARPHGAAIAARPRRRGDRIRTLPRPRSGQTDANDPERTSCSLDLCRNCLSFLARCSTLKC